MLQRIGGKPDGKVYAPISRNGIKEDAYQWSQTLPEVGLMCVNGNAGPFLFLLNTFYPACAGHD
jgi:hypothetical protein